MRCSLGRVCLPLVISVLLAGVLPAQAQFTVTPTTWNVGAEGGTQDITVTSTQPDAPWIASSDVNWVTASLVLGTGSGTVTLTAAPHTTSSPRTATVTIAGHDVTVTQAGATPIATLDPTSWEVGATGGTQDVKITTVEADTAWVVTNSADWVTPNVSSGSGDATITLTASPNSASAWIRFATVTIAGIPVSVTQAGATPAFTMNPNAWHAPAAGGSELVTVTSSLADAPLLFETSAPWVGVSVTGPTGFAWIGKVLAGSTNGYADGTGDAAQFSHLLSIAVSGDGNIYVADRWNHRIRKVTPDGVVTTLAGSVAGLADGPGAAAQFNGPYGIGVDAAGTLYVADTLNHCIRKVTPDGVVTTLAGGSFGTADGAGAAAGFAYPTGVSIDASGFVYVADFQNHRIRRISPDGVVTTLAGSTQGYADGTGAAAQFHRPFDVAVDSSGLVFVADSENHLIRQVTPGGVVTTLAGSTQGYADGTGAAAAFSTPLGIAVDAADVLYVADALNNRIRRISPAGEVTTLDGGMPTLNGVAPAPPFRAPGGVAVDASGQVLYVADSLHYRIQEWRRTALGNATITVSAAPTTSIAPRSATVTLGNETLTVTQGAGTPVFAVDPTNWNAPAVGGVQVITVTSSLDDASWTASSHAAWLSLNVAGGTGSGTIEITAAGYEGDTPRAGAVTIAGVTVQVTQGPPPVMTIDKNELFFGAITTGSGFQSQTSGQIIRLTQTGAGTVSWTITSNQPWLTVTPSSGVGSAPLTVTVSYVPDLPVVGTADGQLTIAFTGTTSTAGPIDVGLNLFTAPMAGPAVGVMDTPVHGITGVTGSIAVTGWALDDVEVVSVAIYRDPVGAEAPGNILFVGHAVFVDGARLDLLNFFPRTPRNTRGGWGYMMLTNMLPNQGNGTFRLYAFATDREGNVSMLDGSPVIEVDNASSTAPFGAIDTPDQGGTVSGIVNNFGWVLVRDGARADVPGGGSVVVYIDGMPVGIPAGWTGRSDLSQLFPSGHADLSSTLAVYPFDSTTLSNGVHTIAWGVAATNGEGAGVGSRYFTVSNGVMGPVGAAAGAMVLAGPPATPMELDESQLLALPPEGAVLGRRGFDLAARYRTYRQSPTGGIVVPAEELDRVELRLGHDAGGRDTQYRGFLRAGGRLEPLPIGARLDQYTGTFTWQPGVGFVGRYDFVFAAIVGRELRARYDVTIVLNPKSSGRVGPQVVIDAPARHHSVGQRFRIAGWAVDLDDDQGSGVDAVHVWAYPTGGGAPIFVGAATLGGIREDIAALHGDRFAASAFDLAVEGLAAGPYDLAVFARSTVTQHFVPARVVRVTVR